jgi:osmoprotectant transport system substrate-binding protein
VLKDDKKFFPLYDLTEVIDSTLLKAHQELKEIFAELNPELTNQVMLNLNAKVDAGGEAPAVVALDSLKPRASSSSG